MRDKVEIFDMTIRLALIWASWHCRNKWIFEQTQPDVVRIGGSFVSFVLGWLEYQTKVAPTGPIMARTSPTSN